MAEIELAPNFGAELKDGFKRTNAWVAEGISWLDDIQAFYRERSAIEREYSQKLSALAKKYYEKKSRKSSTLSVGENPSVTPGSLESASMTTWGVQLSTLEGRAAEHEKYAGQLISSLAEPLKHIAAKYEDLQKSHADFAAKLEKERDGCYADLRKTKSKYDAVCQEVEHKRKKVDSGFDYGKTKAQNAYNQQLSDMRNVKNTYLIAINVTNKQKELYYHEYVPELLDSLQGLSESRTNTLNNIWAAAATIETQTLSRSIELLKHLSAEIPRNNPVLDSMMFVRHNAIQWQDPPDFVFEPSPVWLDDDVMASDPSSKTFLMNILSKSKDSLADLRRECQARRNEVEGAKRVRQLIREGKDKRDEVEIVRAQFHNQELLHEAERRRNTAEVEVSTITMNVGDVSKGARKHTFKNQTFKIPTNCDLCGDRIWGLSAKGLSCEECGFTCHTKCELKVPADCPGELNKEQKKAIKAERQAAVSSAVHVTAPSGSSDDLNGSSGGISANNLQRSDTAGSMNTLSSGYAASAHRNVSGTIPRSTTTEDAPSPKASTAPRRRVMAPPPAAYIKSSDTNGDSKDAEQRGKMLYTYTATGDSEISLSEGQEFTVIEPDDGSGWIKVKASTFGAAPGLVPTSYTELTAHSPPAKSNSAATRPISAAASTSTTSLGGSDGGSGASKPKKQGPAVAPRRGAKKVKHVEALYTYSAANAGEVDMEEGEKMVLITPDQGDGWCEVESHAGKGVVPASWIREV